MDGVKVTLELMQLDDAKISVVITRAVDQYFEVLYGIASDIYDSCIEDFYTQRYPEYYDRHGDLKGFNLYRANEIENNDIGLRLFIDSNQLLKYRNKDNVDKREIVLNMVMDGLRGGPFLPTSEWPMDWYTSYPNGYSKLNIWSSSGHTLNEIYDDFIAEVMTDTKDIFWSIVYKFL